MKNKRLWNYLLAICFFSATGCSSAHGETQSSHTSIGNGHLQIIRNDSEIDFGEAYSEGYLSEESILSIPLDQALPDPTEDYFYQGESDFNRFWRTDAVNTPCDDPVAQLKKDMDNYEQTFDEKMHRLNRAFGGKAPDYIVEGAEELHEQMIHRFEESIQECRKNSY